MQNENQVSTSLSDEALLAAYCAGDAGSFNVLYARHQAKLYRYVLRTVAAQQVAADVFQDAWLKLVQAAPAWQAKQRVAPWLYTVARNRALDHLRLFKNQVIQAPEFESVYEDDGTNHADDMADDVAAVLHNQRLGAALVLAIEALPLLQREAFVLQNDVGLSLEEMAALTNSGIETVKSRLRYARAALKSVLQQGGWHD